MNPAHIPCESPPPPARPGRLPPSPPPPWLLSWKAILLAPFFGVLQKKVTAGGQYGARQELDHASGTHIKQRYCKKKCAACAFQALFATAMHTPKHKKINWMIKYCACESTMFSSLFRGKLEEKFRLRNPGPEWLQVVEDFHRTRVWSSPAALKTSHSSCRYACPMHQMSLP